MQTLAYAASCDVEVAASQSNNDKRSAMPRRLHIDYETRSPVDLNRFGVYAYVESLHTQVILAAWAIDDEPFKVWRILEGQPIPVLLREALLDPEVTIIAHNANFERVISTIVGLRQGFIPKDVWLAIREPKRWSCTAARAAACGLPRKLEKVAQALHIEHQKDMVGHRLMLEMCSPRGINEDGSYVWLEDAFRIERLGEYCIADGYAERDVDKVLPDLSEFEQEVWCATETMNDRGVQVDNRMLVRMIEIVQSATDYLNQRISALTDNTVPKVTNPQAIVKWLKTKGVDTEDNKIGKWILQGLLEDKELDPLVREVLVLRRDGGKSSTAKFLALQGRLNHDNRIRGALLYAGAAATSRWSSRGAQLQNLPRNKVVKDFNKVIESVLDPATKVQDIEKNFGAPMVVASELVRPLFIAPEGYWLARGDYSQIEARVNPWLAGDTKLLDAFREYDTITGYDEKGEPIRKGADLYVVTASQMFGVPPDRVDKELRQTGKVTVLACGFLGGKNALLKMCQLYNMKLTDQEAADAVAKFRTANQPIVKFGYELMNAAFQCMREEPGQNIYVRPNIWFRRNGTCLVMRMPSGRHIVYWYPKLKQKMMPWGEPGPVIEYYAEDVQKRVWSHSDMWPGLLLENIVQATARDIMAYALVQMEKNGMKPVLTVHDEAVCQLSKAAFPKPEDAAEAVRLMMLNAPGWTQGLPIAADASADDRYIKG